MKIIKDEKNILNIIRFAPIISVVFLSFFITHVFLNEREKEFQDEVQNIKQNYLQENRKRVKNEIERIYDFFIFEKNKAEESLRKEIKQRVYDAHAIARNIYLSEKDRHTKEELFEIIKNVLGNLVYNEGKGYYFISDNRGQNLLQPMNREFEKKSFLNRKDKDGYAFVKSFVKTIKEKSERFDTYYWYKPNDNKNTYKKVSFYKYFEPFNIIIGTGLYLEDFEKRLKEDLLARLKTIKDKDGNYIFIFDSKGNVLAHHKDSLIGTNRYNIKNPLGLYVVKDIIEFALDNKKGFMNYHTGVNPENLKNRSKISYLRVVEDWNWILGTGFFLETLNKKIEEKTLKLSLSKQKSINKIISFSLVLTFILVIVSFYISNIISKKFIAYRNKIQEELENTIAKEEMYFKQSKLAAMGEMLGNIAHQWRQPLSAISTAATGAKIQKEMDCLTDQQFDSAVDSINNAAQYLSQTIDDFRGFFDPRNSKETEFKISKTIDKTLTLVNAQFKTKDIQIIKNIDDITLKSIENELIQVLMNILNNSRDALLKLEDKKRYIFIDAFIEHNIVDITIKDTGDGIPNNIIDKVFDPYFTTKHKSRGTGVGLYMCQDIVRNHLNGDILVENETFIYDNESYKGAKFTIKLNSIV